MKDLEANIPLRSNVIVITVVRLTLVGVRDDTSTTRISNDTNLYDKLQVRIDVMRTSKLGFLAELRIQDQSDGTQKFLIRLAWFISQRGNKGMAHGSHRHASSKGIRASLAILTTGPRYDVCGCGFSEPCTVAYLAAFHAPMRRIDVTKV